MAFFHKLSVHNRLTWLAVNPSLVKEQCSAPRLLRIVDVKAHPVEGNSGEATGVSHNQMRVVLFVNCDPHFENAIVNDFCSFITACDCEPPWKYLPIGDIELDTAFRDRCSRYVHQSPKQPPPTILRGLPLKLKVTSDELTLMRRCECRDVGHIASRWCRGKPWRNQMQCTPNTCCCGDIDLE